MLTHIIFSSSIRAYFIEKYGDGLDTYLEQYLSPLEIAYFKKNDGYLDDFFEFNKRPELSTMMHLSGEKLCFNVEVIIKLLEEKKYYFLFAFLSNYFNEADYERIDFEKFGMKKESFLKIVDIYKGLKKIGDSNYGVHFLLDNLEKNPDLFNLEPEKLENFGNVLIELYSRIKRSNSRELKAFGSEILYNILNNGPGFDYIDALDKIEDVFTKNNIPIVGKKYLIYYILNKHLATDDFSNNEIISPTLKNAKGNERFKIIFSDLIRCTMGSNNLSMRHYLEELKQGNDLYNKILNGFDINNLNDEEKEILKDFLGHLCTLYNHTQAGIKEPYSMTGDIFKDLKELIPKFKITEKYDLLDRIVRMYGYFAGFTSYEQAITYMDKVVKEATERGRRMARGRFTLEEGDMIKGINNPEFLYQILQNGSLCKEFLGPHMSSDATPLDTDLSIIQRVRHSISKTMDDTIAEGYGPVYFVIKKGKYKLNRTESGGETLFTTEGPECFVTRTDGHVGIRTGFPTTDIDYIIVDLECCDNFNDIKFAVALNGIYIPIIDRKTERLIFTPEEYDLIRSKMQGLTYYGVDEYHLSSNLKVPIDYDNKTIIEDANKKRSIINKKVKEALQESFNLGFNTSLKTDITPGSVDFIDTGSTGRGTNVDTASDFDFIMRIDECMHSEEIAEAILSKLGISMEQAIQNDMILSNGNLRIKGVKIDGIDTPIDIDISFVSKASEVSYTTDMAISDRLGFIKEHYPEHYEDVLDNIIYAKKCLKEAGVYKPSHARENSQGGLGGVGIENWILQNGGSFYDACVSFYNAATTPYGGMLPFAKFKEKYKIFDFGENFYGRDYASKYDEFVENNMTEEGYKKMYAAVSKYIKKYESSYRYDGRQHSIGEETKKSGQYNI